VQTGKSYFRALVGAGAGWAGLLVPPADRARARGGDDAAVVIVASGFFVVVPGLLGLWSFGGFGGLRWLGVWRRGSVGARRILVVMKPGPPMSRGAGYRAEGTEQ